MLSPDVVFIEMASVRRVSSKTGNPALACETSASIRPIREMHLGRGKVLISLPVSHDHHRPMAEFQNLVSKTSDLSQNRSSISVV